MIHEIFVYLNKRSAHVYPESPENVHSKRVQLYRYKLNRQADRSHGSSASEQPTTSCTLYLHPQTAESHARVTISEGHGQTTEPILIVDYLHNSIKRLQVSISNVCVYVTFHHPYRKDKNVKLK